MPHPFQTSNYETIANYHQANAGQSAHGGPNFPGWHRVFLLMLVLLILYIVWLMVRVIWIFPQEKSYFFLMGNIRGKYHFSGGGGDKIHFPNIHAIIFLLCLTTYVYKIYVKFLLFFNSRKAKHVMNVWLSKLLFFPFSYDSNDI